MWIRRSRSPAASRRSIRWGWRWLSCWAPATCGAANRDSNEAWTVPPQTTWACSAPCMNSMVLMDALERLDVLTRVMSAIEMRAVAEPYIRRRAIRHLEKGRVVIFGAGTGNPFFSTDTAAALRGSEIDADVVIKATKVDGVYDADPEKHPDAKKFSRLSYIDLLNRRLEVMDSTAVSLCMENHLPILVLNLWDPQALIKGLHGQEGRHARIGVRPLVPQTRPARINAAVACSLRVEATHAPSRASSGRPL